MAVSQVSIANRALQLLGAKRIESLSQDHPNARSITSAYEPVRRKLIRGYRWGFAIKRDSIAADVDQTTWGTLNRYALPGDYLRLLLDDESGMRVDWKIEGRFIVTSDASPLEIRYLADITDVAMYDSCFVEMFSAALARACCYEITGSLGQVQAADTAYKEALAEARQLGSFEWTPEDPLQDDWLNARL